MVSRLTRRQLAIGAAALLASGEAHAEPMRKKKVLLAGTRFETPCHRLDSGVAGPTVMIVAGIHGNETAPPFAARALLENMPARGVLLIVPEVNRPALAKSSRFTPKAKHGDLNRNFPTARRTAARGDLAPALWRETVAAAPDWVLDLHEGWGFATSSASMGSSIVRVADKQTDGETAPAAKTLIDVINTTIDTRHKKFKIIGPGPAGSYARAVVEKLGTPAFVFETTWTQKRDLRVSQQLLLVRTMLTRLGMQS